MRGSYTLGTVFTNCIESNIESIVFQAVGGATDVTKIQEMSKHKFKTNQSFKKVYLLLVYNI